MTEYKDACSIIEMAFRDLSPVIEEIELTEAVDRILAEDIISDTDIPLFDNSAMDGFAVKFNEKYHNWHIAGEISAGNFREFIADDLAAVSIMTGSRLPEGFDTVIPIEDVIIRESDIILNTNARYKQGININYKGQDLQAGSIAVEKGTLLNSSHIAATAACGKARVKVYRKLRIGVLATGDELLEITEKPYADKIRASNLYSIQSAVRAMNMTPVNYGIVRDDKEEIRNLVSRALNEDIDILITTGGVSVGKYDFVRDIFAELGVEIRLQKINIKPGKPVVFGVYKNKEIPVFVFGLPGNPVSSLVTFYLFVKASIFGHFGIKRFRTYKAILLKNINKNDSKRHFVRGILNRNEKGDLTVSDTGMQSSGNLVQMSRADCLIVIEENRINPVMGEEVECIQI